jgi:hypothetical protein
MRRPRRTADNVGIIAAITLRISLRAGARTTAQNARPTMPRPFPNVVNGNIERGVLRDNELIQILINSARCIRVISSLFARIIARLTASL